MDQITTYLPGIALAYSAFLLSIMSPGPNVLAIMGTSMSIGRAPGITLALGIATGSLCWSVLAATGLSTLLASYADAVTTIKVAGGAYLLWLAYKSFRSASLTHGIEARTLAGGQRSPLGFYLRGLTIQLTNPKAILAWIAIISLGVQVGAPFWVAASIVAGTTSLSVTIHCIYAVLFSTPHMVRFYSRARRWTQGTLGAFFTFAGLRLLTERI